MGFMESGWLSTLFKKNVVRTISFAIITNIILPKPWFLQNLRTDVTTTIEFTIFPNILLLNPLVLQHVQTCRC